MIKSKSQRNRLRSSLLVASGTYILGWMLGLFIALTLVSRSIAQQLVVHPQLHVSPWYYIGHNLSVEVVLLLGALTLGIGTCLLLFGNGLLSGIVVGVVGEHYGFTFILIGLLPHGIPESGAWILAGTGSILLTREFFSLLSHLFWHDKTSTLDVQVSTSGVVRYQRWKLQCGTSIVALTGFAMLLLITAGVMEAYISPRLLLGM